MDECPKILLQNAIKKLNIFSCWVKLQPIDK